MKKLLITMMICVVAGFSTYAQNGDLMAATHNVYSGITHTYSVTGTDAFLWEVFSDEDCTVPVIAAADTYTFSAGTDATKDLTITWNEPAVAPATYYLRVRQTDLNGCYNYKTLTVVVTSVSTMDFAFDQATSSDCAVNISVSDVSFDVTLTGAYLVHEAGKQAQIEYAIGSGAKQWLDVDLGSGTGAGTYTITIPAAELLSADAEVAENFVINVYQLRDGNGAVKDFTGSPVSHTWTATALPTIVDIAF